MPPSENGPVILIVEDEKNLAQILEEGLRRAGYGVARASTGPEGVAALDRVTPALVVLDIMLPQLDGFAVCENIRTRSQVPVLMLTAKDTEEDKLHGFAVGADDYLTKPFSHKEFIARVRALLRRQYGEDGADMVRVGDLEVDIKGRTVRKHGAPILLSVREFDLLLYLLRRRGTAVTREQLLSDVWGYEYVGDSGRAVDVTVWRLRSKIEDNPREPQYIIVRRGLGYLFGADT
jgi:two-component system response regulator VicR